MGKAWSIFVSVLLLGLIADAAAFHSMRMYEARSEQWRAALDCFHRGDHDYFDAWRCVNDTVPAAPTPERKR